MVRALSLPISYQQLVREYMLLTIVKIVLILLSVLLLTIGLGTHFLAPYTIIKPFRQPPAQTPADFKLKFQNWTIGEGEEVPIAAYYIYAHSVPPLAHILLLHGIGSNKEAWLDLAQILSQQGYATVLIDHRGQGQSGGQYATFGYFEKEDVARVIDRLEATFPKLPIGVWGHSFGGAVALQSMAQDRRIRFGIVQSTFTRLDQIVADYFAQSTAGLWPRWLAKYALQRAGKIASFPPAEVQPVQVAQQILQPVFVAHGAEDNNIKFEYGQAIYEALATEQKELAIVPGAGHENLGMIGGQELLDRQLKFITNCIRN